MPSPESPQSRTVIPLTVLTDLGVAEAEDWFAEDWVAEDWVAEDLVASVDIGLLARPKMVMVGIDAYPKAKMGLGGDR